MIDQSARWESQGIKADYITSGGLKAAGAPPSQTDDERASLQQVVNDLYGQFSDHVQRFRAVDPDELDGAAVVATRAQSLNLIDATGTYEDAYNRLISV